MPTRRSVELAATAWQKPYTKSKIMDTELALAFAEILDVVRGETKTQMHVLQDEQGRVIHACATASLTLPVGHWIYSHSERPMSLEETRHPQGTKEMIRDALKYTIQVCTSHGTDMDFDPDAMCLTMINVLFHPEQKEVVMASYEERPDDNIQVDHSWIIKTWPETDEHGKYSIECGHGWFEVWLLTDNELTISYNGYDIDPSKFRTRGDIRRFLWTMDAECIPGS